MTRELAKAALDAGTDAELSEEAAGAAVKVPSLVQAVAIADPSGCPQAGVRL